MKNATDREKTMSEIKDKKEKIKKKKVKRSSIGGQAVMEGVMMRGTSSMAVAVRDSDGTIRIDSSRFTPIKKRNLFYRIPIIRGVVNFCATMVSGVKTLTKSAEVFGEAEPSKFEKWLSAKLKINAMSLVTGFAMILGFALAIALFFVLPSVITINLFKNTFHWEFELIVENLIEGGVRLAIFIGYLLLVSLMKDIRRVFMYHGAEHRVISCYERGYEMTVANAQKCSTLHNRCGTTFMFFVMLMSIIVFSIFDGVMVSCGVTVFNEHALYKVLAKIALLPLVAGLSYELLKLLALSDFFLLFPLKAPGLLLQKITTRKPTDDMVEVALAAFNTVAEMDADASVPCKTFEKPKKLDEYLAEVKARLFQGGITDDSEAEWIFSLSLGTTRGELYSKTIVTQGQTEKIEKYVRERLTGKPLQYVMGDTEFYGYKIKVNSDVLIPRFETEVLAQQAILHMGGNSARVLDLCTGSGAVAIAVKKQNPNAEVTASDISPEAIRTAKSNAAYHDADVEFLTGDMFEPLSGRIFDVLICNPPYVRSAEIDMLQTEVKDFEPRIALDGGEDGLDFYRLLSEQAPSHVVDGGVMFFEVGEGQAESVQALFSAYKCQTIRDLDQKLRIVKVIKESV